VTAPFTSRQLLLHRYATFVAAATLCLIFAGGLVTSTGSGLAVPDWPLSFGQLFPRMEGGVFYEHGHRMIATVVGLLTVVLAVWLWRAESRRWVRNLGVVAVVAVVLQGVLGGLTVLLRLPDATSIAHAGLAQAFLCMVTLLALATSPRWDEETAGDGGTGGQGDGKAVLTRQLTLVTLLAVYAQILLGALVRHTGSGLIIPTFPLANGRLWPAMDSPFVAYQMAHRVGALVVAVIAVWTAVGLLRRHGAMSRLRRPALALLAVLAWQVFLGALTIWTQRAVIPTTLHVVSGALLLVATLVLAVRAHRILGAPGHRGTAAPPADDDVVPRSAGAPVPRPS
jgi:cytochrome c oxidase assembly protein subunit 15